MLKYLLITVACGLLSLNNIAWAAKSTSTSEAHVTGTIVVPPCDVNANAPMDVNFGNIPAPGPAGADDTYQQMRSVAILCTYYEGTPYVKLTGTVMNGTTSCIATNINGFCIEFYQGDGRGTIMEVGPGANGNGYPITTGLTGANSANGSFNFTMVPWRQSGVELATGTFTATATMSISYD